MNLPSFDLALALALTVAIVVTPVAAASGGVADLALRRTDSLDLPPEMNLGVLPPAAPEPPDNPGSPGKVSLGRLLFFDPILSSTREVACATCHDPRFGWADGRATPIGIGGAGAGPARVLTDGDGIPRLARNTQSLLNVGFNGLVSGRGIPAAAAPMFRDSRVTGLEEQAGVPIRTPGEMCGSGCGEGDALARAAQRVEAIGEYRKRFREAFGPPAEGGVTPALVVRALAAFERTLVTPGAPFDRFLAGDPGAMSAEQQRGRELFREAGCQHCHGGPMFSDFKLHVVGVPTDIPGGPRELRTPTLRNLRHTAPYMHNGSQRSLREVLVFYDQLTESVGETLDGGVPTSGPPPDPLLRALRLREEDFPALLAFLEALSVDDYDRTVPTSVPSGLPVVAPSR